MIVRGYDGGVLLVEKSEHYAALDALRGLAAMAVVLHHVGLYLNAPWLFTNGGLAVDLFFCLSGFVIVRAYETRIQGSLSTLAFMKIRMIRLLPLIVAAATISALYELAKIVLGLSEMSLVVLWIGWVLSALCLPQFNNSKAYDDPDPLFPLNPPQYTLFLELLVNLLFAIFAKKENVFIEIVLVAGALITIAFCGFGGEAGHNWLLGLPRVVASFYIGVLVYRSRSAALWLPRSPSILFSLCVCAFVALMLVPVLLPTWIKLTFVATLSPLLTYTGSFAELGRLRRPGMVAGLLSYPIYALHYPVLGWTNGAYQKVFGRMEWFQEGLIIVLLVVPLSFIAARYFDEPLRRLLTRKSKRKALDRVNLTMK